MWLALTACATDVDADLPRTYRRLTVPEALLASDEARRRGESAFREYCAVCHGARGNGQGPRREALVPEPRDFTDPQWRQSTSARRVFFAIREGLAPAAMPSWKALSEQQAWELTAHVLAIGGTR